jgi:uncharacterized membrane protein
MMMMMMIMIMIMIMMIMIMIMKRRKRGRRRGWQRRRQLPATFLLLFCIGATKGISSVQEERHSLHVQYRPRNNVLLVC